MPILGELNQQTLLANSFTRMVTGTFTGDNNATQAITGLGFTPKVVWILRQASGVFWQRCVKTDRDGTKSFIDGGGGAAATWEDDHIISLDADGFTVGDGSGGIGNVFNLLATDYTYIAMG